MSYSRPFRDGDSRPFRERDTRIIGMNEFYEEVSKGNRDLFEKINEALYINAHTVYLSDKENINYKGYFSEKWREEFGRFPNVAQYNYIFRLYQSFMKIKLIQSLKTDKIDSDRVMWATVVRLEMDLKLIESVEKNVDFTMKSFRDYMNEKYRFILENVIDNIEKADIPFTKNFKKLGEALLPYKEKIQEVLKCVLSLNDEVIQNGLESGRIIRINLASDTGSERREERRDVTPFTKPSNPKSESVTKTETEVKPETVTESVIKFEPDATVTTFTDIKPITNVDESADKKADMDKERVIKDYQMLIADYEEKIKRLEKDLEEYKRQHDELRTYSVGNYDRGVKDLFHILNDKRYGKPLNFLYQTFLFNQRLDANFRGILENFFMALEEMEIEPIVQIEKSLLTDTSRLKTNCDLEFDIKDLVPEKVYFKYVGWKYKDNVIEKPTLAKKTD